MVRSHSHTIDEAMPPLLPSPGAPWGKSLECGETEKPAPTPSYDPLPSGGFAGGGLPLSPTRKRYA